MKWRLLPRNPAAAVEPPHLPEKEAAYLTVEESERLVSALVGHEYELPILVGLYCGLRPAEYLALRWRYIDLHAGELHVVQNVIRVRNDHVEEYMGVRVRGFRFGPAKTHRSRRPVSMPSTVAELLVTWKPVQAAERLRAGEAWADLDLVFTDARGYPHDLHRVRREFYRVLDSAGLKRVGPYALRHTSATLTLKDTKDIKLVARRLGHTNETMVLRRYQHLLPGADREAADRLGELIPRRVQH